MDGNIMLLMGVRNERDWMGVVRNNIYGRCFFYIWITCIFDGTLDKIHGEDENLK